MAALKSTVNSVGRAGRLHGLLDDEHWLGRLMLAPA